MGGKWNEIIKKLIITECYTKANFPVDFMGLSYLQNDHHSLKLEFNHLLVDEINFLT